MKIVRFATLAFLAFLSVTSRRLIAQSNSFDEAAGSPIENKTAANAVYFSPAWVDPEAKGQILEISVGVEGQESLREKHFLEAWSPSSGQKVAILLLDGEELERLSHLEKIGLEVAVTVLVDHQVRATMSLGVLKLQAWQLLRKGFVAVEVRRERQQLAEPDANPTNDELQANATSPTSCLTTCANNYQSCIATCEQHPFPRCEPGCDTGYSNCIADTDADGILYPGDNCPCTASSNQADCDGDGLGDICDAKNEKWVFDADLGARGWDGFTHVGYFSARLEGARRYKNLCVGGSICNQIYKITEKDCGFLSSGGSNEGACCDYHFGTILGRLVDSSCGASGHPACRCVDGTSPRCNF